MIVTKEIAEKYILKRGCYVIHQQPDGDYTISRERLNWKVGMEVFETLQECEAEVESRLKVLKKPGDCPRCYNKATITAALDVNLLELVQGKFAPFYRCSRCQAVWHNTRGGDQFMAYDNTLADSVLSWNSRDLKPSLAFRDVLNENLSFENKEEVYLQSVKLKDGQEHPCAIILLKDTPPDRRWFERKDLFFLDQLAEVRASPHAYPADISRKAWRERDYMHIRDVQTGEVFVFDAFASMFMPIDLAGREFILCEPNMKRRTIVERAERGGPPLWNYDPPPELIYVWGDLG